MLGASEIVYAAIATRFNQLWKKTKRAQQVAVAAAYAFIIHTYGTTS